MSKTKGGVEMKGKQWDTPEGFIRASTIHKEGVRLQALALLKHPIPMESLYAWATGEREVGRANLRRDAAPFPIPHHALKHSYVRAKVRLGGDQVVRRKVILYPEKVTLNYRDKNLTIATIPLILAWYEAMQEGGGDYVELARQLELLSKLPSRGTILDDLEEESM